MDQQEAIEKLEATTTEKEWNRLIDEDIAPGGKYTPR